MATKVFVGSLPSLLDDVTFIQLFEPYGQILSSVCNPDKRYGFVTYGSMEEAQTAINAMNGYTVNGASIVVKLADNQGQPAATGGGGAPAAVWQQAASNGSAGALQSERIYVKGLPPGMNDDSVRNIFAAYGNVTDTKVLVSNGKSSDGQGQSVAIIRMATITEAAWLVENVNGNIPQGLTGPVEVSFAGQRSQAQAAGNGYQAYGGKGAPSAQAGGGRFAPYSGGKGAPVQAGSYGLIPALPPPVLPSSGRGGPGSDALVPNIKQMMQQSGPNATLYIKGLPLGADDLYLYKAFAPFGCVLSAKALPKDGYVIGFVHYASEDQAQGAIVALNGQPLTDGTTLQVAVKTAKA